MKKLTILFFVMGILYLAVEVIWTALTSFPTQGWRLVGATSIWMLFVGGFLGVILGRFNQVNWIRKNLNVFWQCFLGSLTITVIELVSGIILNMILGFNIWSYSGYFLNILGQVCLPMSICWFLFCPFIFWFDDILRYVLYREGNTYNLGSVYRDLICITKTTNYQKPV